MTVAVIDGLVTGTSTASSTSVSGTVGSSLDVAVGQFAFVFVASDNLGTSIGVSNQVLSVTDSAGNVYTKDAEYTYSAGVAGDGATIAVFRSKITSTLSTGVATVQATFSSAVTNKVIRGSVVTADNDLIPTEPLYATSVTASPGSLSQIGSILFRAIAQESNRSLTVTSGFTNISGGTTATMSALAEYKLGFGTSAPTMSGVADNASILLGYCEMSSGTTMRIKGHFGDNRNTTGASSIAATGTADSGDYLIATISKDNVQTTDGQTSEVSGVADAAGNLWTKLYETCNGNGSAGAGTVVSVWSCYVAAPLAAQSITASFSSGTPPCAITVTKFWSPRYPVVTGSIQSAVSDAATSTGNLSVSGLPTAETLLYRGLGVDNAAVSMTTSSGFVQGFAAQGATNAQCALAEFSIQSATGGTSNPALNTARNSASAFMALRLIPTTAWTRNNTLLRM